MDEMLISQKRDRINIEMSGKKLGKNREFIKMKILYLSIYLFH